MSHRCDLSSERSPFQRNNTITCYQIRHRDWSTDKQRLFSCLFIKSCWGRFQLATSCTWGQKYDSEPHQLMLWKGAQAPLNILESPLHASGIFMWSISCDFGFLGQKAVNGGGYEHESNLYPVIVPYTKPAGGIYVILALTFAIFQSLVCSLVLKEKQWIYLRMHTQAKSKFLKSSLLINQITVIAHGGTCFLLWSIVRSLPLLWC